MRRDNSGEMLPGGMCEGYEEESEVVRIGWEVVECIRWLREKRGWLEVEKSENAGLYLCEFVYYMSLCEARKKEVKRKRKNEVKINEGEEKKEDIVRDEEVPMVVFIHVPPEGHPYKMEELTSIVKDVATWMSEKWTEKRQQNM